MKKPVLFVRAFLYVFLLASCVVQKTQATPIASQGWVERYVQSQVPSYTVGEQAQGGIVFYVDSTGRHGLVSMFNDADPGNIFPWGDDNAPTGAANNFGGMTNTLLIVPIEIATNPSLNFAAGQCTQLALNQVGGNCESSLTISCYADYYLPAVNELIWLTNFSNTTSPTSQYWTALSGIYWSSTEYEMSTAYTVNATNSSSMVQDKQTNFNTVRCIRAF